MFSSEISADGGDVGDLFIGEEGSVGKATVYTEQASDEGESGSLTTLVLLTVVIVIAAVAIISVIIYNRSKGSTSNSGCCCCRKNRKG